MDSDIRTGARHVTAGLDRLSEAEGPFVSVYLATIGAIENAAQHTATRWKSLRRELAEAGVDDATLDAIEPLLPDAHQRGDGLAVIAAGGRVLLDESVPTPPRRETMYRVGPLPWLVPLLAWRQASLPHAVVLADRTGAEILVRLPGGAERETEVRGDDSKYLRKVQAGVGALLRWGDPDPAVPN